MEVNFEGRKAKERQEEKADRNGDQENAHLNVAEVKRDKKKHTKTKKH